MLVAVRNPAACPALTVDGRCRQAAGSRGVLKEVEMKDRFQGMETVAGKQASDQTDAQIDASRPSLSSDPIAIVGLAFRFPGDISDEEQFWQALVDGQDLVKRVPEDRWAVDEFEHPKRGEPGRSITFSAGVLSRIDEFDATFFGISPREAAWLDPQQRLLLELSWEAMENAGTPPSSVAGSDCAVYIGISGLDYGTRGLDDFASFSSHLMTGNTLSIAANRLSYVYDLRGPSLAVDTACSSSLVALHHACNCLRSGESSMAIVGGVNLLLNPYPFVGFTKASMLSAVGRCKPFDASGDGYVRAEGGAVLLLKPLSKALADGDAVQGLILASGVNTDGGRKTGITIPSAEGQAELMSKVLAISGRDVTDIDFIEAHGTGTAVGDPIEAAAIGEIYGNGRETPLPITSVKANLGHLEPASGMAGLVKALLALKNRALPPSLHLKKPNPRIDLKGLNLELVTKYRALERDDVRPLVAGVNSFGFGGANAHVLVQAPPEMKAADDADPEDVTPPPLFLSARSDSALQSMAGRYAGLLRRASARESYDIAYAAAFNRERLDKRLALVAISPAEASQLLEEYAKGETPAGVVIEDSLVQQGATAFVYSGNGSQWLGMGRVLLAESGRFGEIVGEIDAAISAISGFSVVEELHAENDVSRLADTVVAQPLLFAMQVALTLLLREQGCEPAAVTGHSVGEVTAAWAAGIFDLAQAIRIICARSKAQGETRGCGRMAAVGMSESGMRELMAKLGDDLDVEIAGVNSPNNITVAGSLESLQRIGQHLEPQGVFFYLLELDYAFHSRQMDVIEPLLLEALEGLEPHPTQAVDFVSTVSGDVMRGDALGARYWWHNVRQPVRFAEAMASLQQLGCRVFVEIGPHAILQRYMLECVAAAGSEARVLPTLRRDDDGLERVLEAALRIHLLADQPRHEVFFPLPGRRVRLPNYPWQKERHWHPMTTESLRAIQRRRVHPLLGWRLSDTAWGWENTLDPEILSWLADHRVGGAIVFPGAAYAEMALAAAREWLGDQHLAIEELDIVAPMVFDGDHARTLRLFVNERDGGFQISSRQRLSDDAWRLHAAGRIIETSDRLPSAHISRVPGSARVVQGDTHYRLASSLGLDYGEVFQGMAGARVADRTLEAELSFDYGQYGDGYLLHPAVLDVCYQSLVDFFQPDIEEGRGIALLPVKAGRLELLKQAEVARFRVRVGRFGVRSVLADFELLDAEGGLIAVVSGCRFRAAPLHHQAHKQIISWQVSPWLQPHAADTQQTQLPPQPALLEVLRATSAEEDSDRERWFKETLPLFEALTVSFIYEAIQSVVQRKGVGVLEEVIHSSSPYIRWLCSVLTQERLLADNDGSPRLVDEAELPGSEEIWQALLRDTPECLPQLTLVGRVGRHLSELILGDIDDEQFSQALQQSPATEMLFEDDPAYSGIRLAIEKTLRTVVADLPAHRRLRVLEIAAASSELPREVVHLLPRDRLDYTLAISNETLYRHQLSEYQDDRNIHVAKLDMAEWQLEYEESLPERYDIVILRHVLHHAGRPHAVLTWVRRLLAHGGLLLTAERYPDWSAHFVAGIDPTWWHVNDAGDAPDSRMPVSSLHSPNAWKQALQEEGFEDVEDFSEPASEGLAEGAYLLLARCPEDKGTESSEPEVAKWQLLADEAASGMAEHLYIQLESQGQEVSVSGVSAQAVRPRDVDHLVLMSGWGSSAESAPQVLSEALAIVQGLVEGSDQPPRLWILTHGGALVTGLPEEQASNPVQSALWGFGRVVMNEYPGLECTLVDLACDPEAADVPRRIQNELLRPDGVNEVVLGREARYSLSLHESTAPAVETVEGQSRFGLDFKVPGQLRNLLWLPEQERTLEDDEVEVRTMATGLNFRDVMYLMGLLPDEAVENGFAGASLGLEFSGVVTRVGERVHEFQPGDPVMGFGSSCFSSHVITRADALARMPAHWKFEAAATVPTVFFTVYYALKHLADLQPGERVLIHGAAGGVGIAAVQLALHLGAEIFATAGNDEKRDFVHLLGADHVLDSRSLAFADDILAITNGEGVDVVLNSLAGEAIRRNLRVLKPFGRFLELGKRDFFENTPIGLRPFKDNISYFGIDADQLLTARPQLAGRLFREVMALFREDALTPLPYRVFSADRVVEAFRFMQQARHIGKVVVSLADARPALQQPQAEKAENTFDKDSTWLISGGLAGFGLQSARWLAAQGVGNLALLGRRGIETPGASEVVEELEAQGVKVEAIACDITDAKALAGVIKHVRDRMASLKGVLHAAMVIDDRLIANLDADSMAAVLQPKLVGAWNLHKLTLDIPLEHFVMYSSITTSIGNPGQANYVAANAGLEGLAELRRHMGLPAVSIGWGPIGDTGYLTRNTAVMEGLEQRLGRTPLAADDALAELGVVLARNERVVSPANFDWNTLSRLLPSSTSARFATLNRALKDKGQMEDSIDFKALIAGKSPEEVAELVSKLVVQEIAQTLCIGVDRVDVNRSLHDLGMDSLMGVELALGLEQRFGIQLPAMMLNDSPSAARVTARIVEKLLGGEEGAPDDAGVANMVEGLARQHGESAMSRQDVENLGKEAEALARKGASLIV